MAVFRIEQNVPEIYVRESRDFQLFCAVFDILFGYLKQEIDSMQYLTDTAYCDQKLLPILQTKLGYFAEVNTNDYELRKILHGFSEIVKYKGSKLGINKAINLFLRSQNIYEPYSVTIINKDSNENNVYSIVVELSDISVARVDVLTDILRFVIPTGYKISFAFYTEKGKLNTHLSSADTIELLGIEKKYNSGIVRSGETLPTRADNVNATFIASANTEDATYASTNTISGTIPPQE